MIHVYNCWLSIEMTGDAGVDANREFEIGNCNAGCCPMDSECPMKVTKGHVSHESI